MADTDAPAEETPSRSDGGQSSTPSGVTLGELFGTTGGNRTKPSPSWLFRHGLYIGAILLVGFAILPELLLSLGAGWPVGMAWALAEALRYGAIILAGLYAVNVAVADALAQ